MSARRLESQRILGLDRLPPVALALLLYACTEGKSAPPPSRVEAVRQTKQQANESELCDVLKPSEGAPSFELPELRGAAPKSSTTAYRWLNVWATWCPPCIEELPLLTRFRDELSKDGAQVELSLLSVDDNSEVVDKFAETHPEVRGSLQIKDSAALEAWLPKVGLDGRATLPIHLFIDGQGKVRCARTGAIRESDLPAIKKLVSSGR